MDANHEIIIPNKGLPFKMFIFEGKNGNYVRNKHWHTSIEIFAVFKGSVRFFLNDEEYYLKEGEFVIVFGNENNTSYLCTQDITMFIGQTVDCENIGEKIPFDKLSEPAQIFFLELIYFY